MSGQPPNKSSGGELIDRRYSIDEDTEEEINLEELNPQESGDANGKPPTPEQSLNAVDNYDDVDGETELVDADDDAEEAPPACGWCCLHPGFLQCCRTDRWVLFALCMAGIVQGMVINGFYTIDITTLERRFGLRSAQTGLIAGAYDIASVISLIPITYIGGRVGASKPKWLACGMFIMGLGSLVFVIPQFVSEEYVVNTNDTALCFEHDDDDDDDDAAANGDADLSSFRWVFFLGQFLHGIGSSPLYTLGVTFIDESVRTNNSSLFLAVYYTMAIIGTAIGYLLGGLFLTVYTDLSVDTKQLGLEPDDNAWIGAWWIGYLISVVCCFVLSIWLLAFPPYLPGTPAVRAAKVSEAHQALRKRDEYEDDTDVDVDVDAEADAMKSASLPRATVDLLGNPTLTLINLAAASEGFINAGFLAFLPKFIENQFSINPTQASLIMGLIAVPTGGGGTFLGGYLVRKFELRCAGILKFCMVSTFLSLLCATAFLFTCPSQSFAGVTALYPVGSNLTLGQECNERCGCSPRNYEPICGLDATIYYSPCYAGCTTEVFCDKDKYFNDCKCIGDTEDAQEASSVEPTECRDERKTKEDVPEHEAVAGKCPAECDNLVPFTILIVLLLFCTFLTAMPALAATLRCVDEEQRSFALGLQWVAVRILGSTPSPILFGILIDATCLQWKDAEKGSCLIFDNSQLSFLMMLLTMVGKSFNILCYFMAWMCYVPFVQPEPEEKEEDEESLLSERRGSTTYGTNYQ